MSGSSGSVRAISPSLKTRRPRSCSSGAGLDASKGGSELIDRNRTTAVDGTGALDAPDTQFDPPRVPLRRLLRAMLELARSHRQLHHRPTRAQVRDLARWNGRNPRSYRLDRASSPSCR